VSIAPMRSRWRSSLLALAMLSTLGASVFFLYTAYFYAWKSSLPDTSRESWEHLQRLSAIFGWMGLLALGMVLGAGVFWGIKALRRTSRE
jgi:hypothetical protein